MNNIIIGLAGHIDHGKTSLVKALTGFDGDQTNEEKTRGITIDLSFSSMNNNYTNIAFIDVPGHEKLVKNMIAGAFGFDYAMVVVDAKEKIMPQTREHLEIISALGIKEIIAVITKSDLVTQDELPKIKNEIKEYTQSINLDLLNILPTSIKDPSSIKELKNYLFTLKSKQKKENGFFRFYIDRVFSIKGSGCVVTGTVIDKSVSIGDKLFVYDKNIPIKVRSIQVHSQDVQTAKISQRVALNLSGVKTEDLARGMVIAPKGFLRGFKRVDIFIKLHKDKKLANNAFAQLYIGSKKCDAKINTIFVKNEILFASVEANEDIFAIYKEPIIIRQNGITIGGGEILNPIGDPMKNRQKQELLWQLYNKNFNLAFAILLEIHKKGFGLISSNQRFAMSHLEILEIAQNLENSFLDQESLVLYPQSSLKLLTNEIFKIFEKNKRAILSATSLNKRFIWASENFINSSLDLLEKQKILKKENSLFVHIDCDIKDAQTYIKDAIFKAIDDANIAPHAPYNIYDELEIDIKAGDNALKDLCSTNKVTRLAHNLFISSKNLSILLCTIREIIKQDGYCDVGKLKDNLDLSRKYAISYLEYLDKFDDIENLNNKRVLKK